MSFRQKRSKKCGFQQLLLGCRKMRACQPVYVRKASLCIPACIASLHTWTENLVDMCLIRCAYMHCTTRTDMSIATLHACTCIYVRVHQDTRGMRLECAADMRMFYASCNAWDHILPCKLDSCCESILTTAHTMCSHYWDSGCSNWLTCH